MTIVNCQTSVLVFIMSLLAFDVTLAANNPEDALHSKLVVGTKHVPSFAIKNSDGVWSGISIDLWKQIAGELKLDYKLCELSLDELIESINLVLIKTINSPQWQDILYKYLGKGI